jgi:hypothetical protein
MRKNTHHHIYHHYQQQEFNPILDLMTKCLSYITNGSVRVNVDDQTAMEINGHSKGKKSDISIDIEDHGDRLITAALVDEDDEEEKKKLGLLDRLSNARQFANSLANNDLTLSVSYKGKEVMMLGKNAKPKLSKLVTRSSHIQIKSLLGLRKLDQELTSDDVR